MPEEDIETAELKEHLDEGIEEAHERHEAAGKGGHGGGGAEEKKSSWTRYLSLSTAIIAVFAAVASLESGANSNEAILAKSDAMLDQARASDQWAYFQAKGIKASIAASQADLVRDTKPDAAAKLVADATRYHAEADAMQKTAEDLEREEKNDNVESAEMMERHHHFAISVTMLQIAIAMSAIAALTRRKPLWYVGMAVSLAGIVMFVRGFL